MSPAQLGANQRAWCLHHIPGFAAKQHWFRRWRERAAGANALGRFVGLRLHGYQVIYADPAWGLL